MGRYGLSLLLPVELRAVNRHREHQQSSFYAASCQPAYKTAKAYNINPIDNLIAMAQTDTIDQIAERVDHLLLRHEELLRTQALLNQQVQALTAERDQLKSRLSAARARVDALIERLPQTTTAATPEAFE